ncbi:hypothetical protein RclHR1_21000006 [Rhizophagus clarus]|uniref:Uncharacterized protein n=1 Tax=Rhizophagus clarus TaxID=94130 RepID=A0A2Z6R7Y8_9GLOM|nr:hypothetical protein RclHR1_21000006 [Rhizophagus clarus]
MRDYRISEYLKNLSFLSNEEMNKDYPVKPFQRPYSQRNNNSARFDRIEEGLEKTQNNVNHKGSCPKGLVAQSNFIQSYFMPLKLIVPSNSNDEENDGDGYDEDNNRWTGYDPLEKKK